MKCGVCGSTLHTTTTDLPFKVGEQTIVMTGGFGIVMRAAWLERRRKS